MSRTNKQGEEMKAEDIRESTTTVKRNGVTSTKPLLIIPDSETQRIEAIRQKEGGLAANTAYHAMMVEMFAEGKRRFGEHAQFAIGTDPAREAAEQAPNEAPKGEGEQ